MLQDQRYIGLSNEAKTIQERCQLRHCPLTWMLKYQNDVTAAALSIIGSDGANNSIKIKPVGTDPTSLPFGTHNLHSSHSHQHIANLLPA
jgi:hypothetical protein